MRSCEYLRLQVSCEVKGCISREFPHDVTSSIAHVSEQDTFLFAVRN